MGQAYISKEPVASVSEHSSTLKKEAARSFETSVRTEIVTTLTGHQQYVNNRQ
jgi:hypothetical protein